MIIHAGRQTRQIDLGRVAEYCPMCRNLVVGDLVRINQVLHVYWVPLGSGKDVALELRCRACTTRWAAPDNEYPDATPYAGNSSSAADVEALLSRAPPGRVARIMRSLEAYELAVAGRVSASVRAQLIAEPLIALAYDQFSRRRLGGSGLKLGDFLLLFACAIAAIASGVAWYLYAGAGGFGSPTLHIALPMGISVLTLVVIGLGLRFSNSPRRRQAELDRLRASLLALAPSGSELAEACAAVRAAKLSMPQWARLEVLRTQLGENARPPARE